MSKDDFFMKFCVGDYLRDTTDLSTAEHGAYLLLLFHCWVLGGSMPDDDVAFARVTRMSISEWNSMRKRVSFFFKIRQKKWTHKRVLEDRKALKKLQAARRKGAAKTNKRIAERIAERNAQGSVVRDRVRDRDRVPSTEAGERENTRANPGSEPSPPTLEEVKLRAEKSGVAEWKAADWWNEMEGCGWLDYRGRRVVNWQPIFDRMRTKWEADGRPMGPPVKPSSQNHTAGKTGQSRNAI